MSQDSELFHHNNDGVIHKAYVTDRENESLSSIDFTDEHSRSVSESSSSYLQFGRYTNSDGPVLNKTFSDNRLRDIERDNSILMSKILSKSKRAKQYKLYQQPQIKSSFDINRKKAQAKIEHENKILLKKIQSVKPVVKK